MLPPAAALRVPLSNPSAMTIHGPWGWSSGMEFDLIIRGGTVVTAADVGRSEVGVKDGRIVALAKDLPRAASEIDASGLLVLPGGIDSHVHFELRSRSS